ncbi:MAG: YiiD C-terminal domain-containing protein [Gammaproteobacteria bacterium]|nr:YiiD C-terminal domain-containing protein [Gammaproteobacteria bacterium]
MKPVELEKLLHQEIPITQALAIQVIELEVNQITIKAPFEQNKNIHNTAFAGSIYTTATLAGWSLVTNFLKDKNLDGSVVLAKGEIKYLKPINGDIVAHTEFANQSDLEKLQAQFENKGKARINLTINVIEDEIIKAQLNASFAIV